VDHVTEMRELWAALSHGDLAPLETALDPHARWRAVEDGPWNCENRAAILKAMRHNLAAGLEGSIEEAFEVAGRVVVAFRPEAHTNPSWPLENGLRHLVVTLSGERITELKGCSTRAAALDYAAAG
jgi:hypothetical protein